MQRRREVGSAPTPTRSIRRQYGEGMSVDEAATVPDFSARLHALREQELRRLPSGARTVLHGGAADRWYFEWFESQYAGEVERHVCVEAFAPRPDGLPSRVEWLQRTLGDIEPVADHSIDLVFAGQVIEHLWADDVAGFLLESRRVLDPAGRLVLDSPNRWVTEAIDWRHPQHTTEFSVAEIAELVQLAGFEVEELRGVLLGYDRVRHRFLDLHDEGMAWETRAAEAPDRPEDSFIWWLVARPRLERRPDQVRALAHDLERAFRDRRLGRLASPLPIARAAQSAAWVSAPRGGDSALIHGPCFPVDAGAWRARFGLRLDADEVDPQLVLGRVDVTSEAGTVRHASRHFATLDLRPRAWTLVDLDFELDAMLTGVELRAFTFGRAPLSARLSVALGRAEDFAEQPPPLPLRTPEPRSVELLDVLQRRLRTRVMRRVRRTLRPR
jgi:SAM-dependent methyltransferase